VLEVPLHALLRNRPPKTPRDISTKCDQKASFYERYTPGQPLSLPPQHISSVWRTLVKAQVSSGDIPVMNMAVLIVILALCRRRAAAAGAKEEILPLRGYIYGELQLLG
jgi:hypothetical protein